MYPAANSPGTIAQGYNHVTQEGQDAPNRNDLIRLDWMPSTSWRIYGKLLQSIGTRRRAVRRRHHRLPDQHPRVRLSRRPARQPRHLDDRRGHAEQHHVPRDDLRPRAQRVHEHPALPDDFTKANLGLSAFPMLYPGAVQLDLPPRFNYGAGASGTHVADATAPSTRRSSTTTRRRTWPAASRRPSGQHTAKAGVYFTHGLKPQSSRAAANGNISFQNDASNPYDTGYPFANAALGHLPDLQPGGAVGAGRTTLYNNVEWYAQDNWKVNDRLTLDYGLRFYWMQPTHDTERQTSNFLPDKFERRRGAAALLPGASSTACAWRSTGSTGQTLPAAAIGRIVPGSGTLQNGLFQAGRRHQRVPLRERRHPVRAALRHVVRRDGQAEVSSCAAAPASSTTGRWATRSTA